MYFNPRSLTGATIFSFKEFKIIIRFQSTLPHGSDHVRPFLKGVVTIFQSTLPHGSDSKRRPIKIKHIHFNPRSLTGATGALSNSASRHAIFQSTLPHGSDDN